MPNDLNLSQDAADDDQDLDTSLDLDTTPKDDDVATPADNADEGDQDSDDDDELSEEDKAKAASALEDKDKQDKVAHAFAKKQRQIAEERTKREAAESRAAEAERKLSEFTKPKRPGIPELPSAYDADFEAKMATRDKAITDRAIYDAQVAYSQTQVNEGRQAAQVQRQKEVKTKTEAFEANSKTLGLSADEMAEHDTTVALSLGKRHAETAEYLLDHADGPLIVKFLAKTPLELDKVSAMTPLQAAVYISSNIAPKAKTLKPVTPKIPAPVRVIDGHNSSSKDSPYLKGATFE